MYAQESEMRAKLRDAAMEAQVREMNNQKSQSAGNLAGRAHMGVPNLGACTNAALDAPTQPEIRRMVNRLAEESARLRSAIAELAERVQPVLRPVPPSPVDGCGNPRLAIHTDLGRALDELADTLITMRLQVADVVERVEL